MLWENSHGNPFYLSELARFGAEHGQLERQSEVWWWVGEAEMPPRLSELLLRRIDALDEAAREAVDVLALGEPLPYETLAAVVGEDAILDLDRARIIDQRRAGRRAAAAVLPSAAARGRRAAAERDPAARPVPTAPGRAGRARRPGPPGDLGGRRPAVTPNAELLLAAADAVLLNDPAAALRLAERAQRAGPQRLGGSGHGRRPASSSVARTWPARRWTRAGRWSST